MKSDRWLPVDQTLAGGSAANAAIGSGHRSYAAAPWTGAPEKLLKDWAEDEAARASS